MIALLIADVVLFLISNVTAKNSHSPGTVSNILWGIGLVGGLLLITLCLVRLVQSRRPRTRA